MSTDNEFEKLERPDDGGVTSTSRIGGVETKECSEVKSGGGSCGKKHGC